MQDRLMQFFAYSHLPAHLQEISKPFGDLAEHIVATLPSNPERTVALRKLLEAKDCAVRAKLYVEPTS
jgi:ferritin-like protein